jgi:hypothetical protein
MHTQPTLESIRGSIEGILTRCNGFNLLRQFQVVSVKGLSIHAAEHQQRHESRTLVTIHERLILRDANRQHSSLTHEIGIVVVRGHLRPEQCRLEQAGVTQSSGALAHSFHHLGMERDNIRYTEITHSHDQWSAR